MVAGDGVVGLAVGARVGGAGGVVGLTVGAGVGAGAPLTVIPPGSTVPTMSSPLAAERVVTVTEIGQEPAAKPVTVR